MNEKCHFLSEREMVLLYAGIQKTREYNAIVIVLKQTEVLVCDMLFQIHRVITKYVAKT